MPERSPVCDKTPLELKLDILEFAWEHHLMIHPDKDLEGFCERTVSSGHCICRDTELFCPCDSALEFCRRDGYCTCRLFIVPERYAEALNKARERWRRKLLKST
ncbi:MAG: hypothetical protein QUS09_09110 [Methanotrichaceae archaeon]|nr:hypothetical protein [Methanotrichaceae archaeon]